MNDLKDDLIEGIKAIARFQGTPERRTFYLAEKGLIPGVWKEGGRYRGLKSKIREGYERKATGGRRLPA
jgi:hypothetical protein